MSKAPSSFIFDVDGTLLQTSELIFQTFKHVLRPYDFNIEKSTITPLIGLPLYKIFQHFLGDTSDYEKQKLANEIHTFQSAHLCDLVKIFPSVYEDLEQIKLAGHKLGIVTSRNNQTLELLLEHFKLKDFFSVVVTPNLTNKHKPDPEPLELALKLLSIHPRDAIYVGDAPFDITCAKSAGTKSALVAWTENKDQIFPDSPDFIIDRISNLL